MTDSDGPSQPGSHEGDRAALPQGDVYSGWGPLALVGGDEWQDGCSFDADLLASSLGSHVLVLPTGAAYEHPERAVERARKYFEPMGAEVNGLMVVGRTDALDGQNAAVVASARFIYLCGGSPLHLRSVLKDSPVWDALVAAWRSGAVVAGSSAGAMVLGDPMVDPRGGALTVGLGLISSVAVLAHADTWSHEKAQRTVSLATGGLRIVAVDERTATIRSPEGTWSVSGAGTATVYVDGRAVGLDALA